MVITSCPKAYGCRNTWNNVTFLQKFWLTLRFVYSLQNEESCQVEAAEMIASLLWNRDSTLTGQVFDIRQ